jgi:hypothetical protein
VSVKDEAGDRTVSRGRVSRFGRWALYWLVVVVVSIALVVGFILLLEVLDSSSVGSVAIASG